MTNSFLRNNGNLDIKKIAENTKKTVIEYSNDLKELSNQLKGLQDHEKKIVRETIVNHLIVKYTTSIGNSRGNNLEKMINRDLDSYEKGVYEDNIENLLINFADFLSEDHKLNWLWTGHIPLGGLMWLYAAAKTGKSDFINALMYSTIHSGEFLGFPVKRGKVLYIQAEESNLSIQIKAKAHGFTHPEILESIKNDDSVKMLRRINLVQDFEKLLKIVEHYKPTLVIIDTVITVMDNSGLSVKDAEFVSIFRRIQSELCIPLDITVLALHHVTKAGTMSGSNFLNSVGEGSIKLERSTGNLTNVEFDTRNTGKFYLTISRDMDEDTNKVSYTLIAEEGLNSEETEIRNAIIRQLLNKRSITAREIYENFPNKDYVKNVLTRLLSCCMIDYKIEDDIMIYYIPQESFEMWNAKYLNDVKKDIAVANKIASFTDKSELEDFTKNWDKDYKLRIWNLLDSKDEKLYIKNLPKLENHDTEVNLHNSD